MSTQGTRTKAPAATAAATAVRKRVKISTETRITKLATDHRLGVIMGFLFVSKADGEDYYDHHGHNIPESEIIPAALHFSDNGAMDVMHDRNEAGSVPFVWPFTTEFAKALGIAAPKFTGLLIGVRPRDPSLLKRVDDGELVAFSLDGIGYETEV